MNFQDIFKSSFLDNLSSFSILDTAIALALAFAIGLFIFLVYKNTYSGVMYSPSFGVSLVAMTLITTVVIMAVTSNVVLSLGMVGALSIVRFRTAIKEPMDICFLFWAIGAGIVLAAGLVPLALCGSIVIGAVIMLLANRKTHLHPYIVVIRCDGHESEVKAKALLEKNAHKSIVKSKTAQQGFVELNMEIRLKEDNTDFINELSALDGVQSAVLVSYNGEYMS